MGFSVFFTFLVLEGICVFRFRFFIWVFRFGLGVLRIRGVRCWIRVFSWSFAGSWA